MALQDVSLEIRQGERVALIGPSGAGKTTLLKLLHGGAQVSEGRLEVDDRELQSFDPAALRSLRANIGFVHQDLCLVPNLRACQNVLAGQLGKRSALAGLRMMTLPRRQDLEEAHRLLDRVGIAEKLFEPTQRLSGGQAQRVAIARALFQAPSCLIADEPVSSVDPTRARDVVSLLIELAEERELTLIVSLHNVALAKALFPRVIGLRQGRVCLDGRPDELSEAAMQALFALDSEPKPSAHA